MPMTEGIARRAIGQFPISIATSLALEAACGIYPDREVDKAPILEYEELWINLKTLYRNFMGSLDKDTANGVFPQNIAETVSEEMEHIKNITNEYSKGRTTVIFYVSNYANMESVYKLVGVIRKDNTDKQKEFTAIGNQTIEILLKSHEGGVLVFERKLKPKHKKTVLILTHIPYDLLSHHSFTKLVLLESHTGKIKSQSEWYTKYLNGNELSMIPFREDFIQVFGDKETFRPFDLSVRVELIEIATKYHWSAITTRDKLAYGIGTMKNLYARELLRNILV